MTWRLYQTGPDHADEVMAKLTEDGKTVLSVAAWKAELSAGYILNTPGDVEHRLVYLKQDSGRKRYTLKEFIRWRDGPTRGKPSTSMAGRVAEVRYQKPRAFGDGTVTQARALMAGGMSLRAAAGQLGVKPGTLSDRLKQPV